MARMNRREVLSEGEIQVVHCVNLCVRRGYLAGSDPLTGRDYEHRLEFLVATKGNKNKKGQSNTVRHDFCLSMRVCVQVRRTDTFSAGARVAPVVV